MLQMAQGHAAEAEPYVKRVLADLPGKLPKENTGTRFWYQQPKPVDWSDYLVARLPEAAAVAKTWGAGRESLDHACATRAGPALPLSFAPRSGSREGD